MSSELFITRAYNRKYSLTSEFFLFHSIIDYDYFEKLNTPEKIKLLVENDIFGVKKRSNIFPDYNLYSFVPAEFVCVENIIDLDFNSYSDSKFDIYGKYKADNISGDITFSLNPFLESDVFEGIKTAISLCSDLHKIIDNIEMNVNLIPDKYGKIEYLRSKLNEINPFGIKEFTVEYDKHSNELILAPETSAELVADIPDFIIEWITGRHYPGSMFSIKKHPNLERFYYSYKKFYVARLCEFKIKTIQNEVSSTQSIKEHIENTKTVLTKENRYSYFFNKINIIITLYEMKCKETEVEHKEIKRLEKLDEFLSTIEDDNNLKKNNKEFWTNYMYAYFLYNSGILDNFRHAFDKTGSLYRMIGTIIQLDPKNFETRLKKVNEMNKKSISEISPYYRRVHKIIDPIITHYENLV